MPKERKKRAPAKVRGIFERIHGSGVWWIQYFDCNGRRRREKAGTFKMANDLLTVRRNQKLEHKLPENLRSRIVPFTELCTDAESYVKANNSGYKYDLYRIAKIKEQFRDRGAGIPVEDLRLWFDKQTWKPATANRYKAMLSLIFRLAIEHGKAKENPARLIKRKKENNKRDRYLNKFKPAKTELEYLKGCDDEESRLRAVIGKKYPEHLPEFEIALHTGMRPSEQYGMSWDDVDLKRRSIRIPKSKNGEPRDIPLNSIAFAAFKELQKRALDEDSEDTRWVCMNKEGERLYGYKHWFEPAVEEAGIKDFTWYCLRHTFASRLAMAGVPIRDIAELMGHRTIQMTMRYAHLAPETKHTAVEKLAGFELPTTSDTENATEADSQNESKTVTLQ